MRARGYTLFLCDNDPEWIFTAFFEVEGGLRLLDTKWENGCIIGKNNTDDVFIFLQKQDIDMCPTLHYDTYINTTTVTKEEDAFVWNHKHYPEIDG